MTKFLFRKSRKCIQKSSKKIFVFIIDFGNIIINHNLYLTDRNYRNIILHIKYEKYELIKKINKI